MVVTPVIAMVPNQYKYTIRVRVSRLWRPRFNNTDAYDGLHYVLVDEDVTFTDLLIPVYPIVL